MRNKRFKEIEQKLDKLLDYVVAIQSLLIRSGAKDIQMPHKTLREQAEDDSYWDPTKFPEVGESELDEHFNN